MIYTIYFKLYLCDIVFNFMNKKANSPFQKVTKFVANKNGTDFVFQATDEKELLLSTDILSEAISLQKLEETISEGPKKIYRRRCYRNINFDSVHRVVTKRSDE